MENTLALYHTLVAERGQQTNAVLVATVSPCVLDMRRRISYGRAIRDDIWGRPLL